MIPSQPSSPEASDQHAALVERLNSEEFYELMQAYRHSPLLSPLHVEAAFLAVQTWVLKQRADQAASDTAQRDRLEADIEVLRGELRASEDGSGITNVAEQHARQLAVEREEVSRLQAEITRLKGEQETETEAALKAAWHDGFTTGYGGLTQRHTECDRFLRNFRKQQELALSRRER